MSQVFAFLIIFDLIDQLKHSQNLESWTRKGWGSLEARQWTHSFILRTVAETLCQRAPADHSEKQKFLSPTCLIVLNQSEEQDCHHLGFLTPIKRCFRSRCGYLFQGAAHNLSHIVQKRHYICSIQPWNELVPLKHLVKLRSLVRKRRHRLWGRQAGLKPLQADGKLKEGTQGDALHEG